MARIRDWSIPIIVTVLVAAYLLLALPDIAVNPDEAQALWVVRDNATPNADFTSALRSDLGDFFDRVQQQPQPPLYFVTLEAWTQLFGHTIFIARALSMLLILLALLVTMLLAQSATPRVRLPVAYTIALVALLYTATEAYVYGLLGLLAAFSTWMLIRWGQRRNLLNGLLYMLALLLVLYTAHVAIWIVGLHLLYALRQGMLRPFLAAVILAAIGFAPWLLLFQMRALDGLTVRTFALTWLVVLLPIVAALLSRAFTMPQNLAFIGPEWRVRQGVVLLVVVGYVVIMFFILRRPTEPASLLAISALRTPDEPTLTYFTPRSPYNYYDQRPETRLSAGISIGLGWRTMSPAATDAALTAITAIDGVPKIWVMMPDGAEITRVVSNRLGADYVIGYTLHEGDMLFARFDRRE